MWNSKKWLCAYTSSAATAAAAVVVILTTWENVLKISTNEHFLGQINKSVSLKLLKKKKGNIGKWSLNMLALLRLMCTLVYDFVGWLVAGA